MNDANFDHIVSGFYRAATGEMNWTEALHPVQAAFGARTAALQTVDAQTGRLLTQYNGGPAMHKAALHYVRDYHQIDPRRSKLIAFGAQSTGQWWHCHEHFDDDFAASDQFHQEFLTAYDARYLSCVMLQPANNLLTGFALEIPASRGVLTADECEAARRLGTHMADALRAYQRVRRLTAQALAGHALLSAFPYPMWLIDAERFVHFANSPAQRETDAASRVALRGANLLLTHQRADVEMTERLHVLQGEGQGATAVVDAAAKPGDLPTWLHLSVLIPQAVFGAFGDRPLVLATLFDPQQVSTLDPFALAAVFKLTPAQAKVATQLADGLTAKQIAVLNGTSEATVRSHVRCVLERLGAQRTADVVRMLRQGEALWAGAAGRPDAG